MQTLKVRSTLFIVGALIFALGAVSDAITGGDPLEPKKLAMVFGLALVAYAKRYISDLTRDEAERLKNDAVESMRPAFRTVEEDDEERRYGGGS